MSINRGATEFQQGVISEKDNYSRLHCAAAAGVLQYALSILGGTVVIYHDAHGSLQAGPEASRFWTTLNHSARHPTATSGKATDMALLLMPACLHFQQYILVLTNTHNCLGMFLTMENAGTLYKKPAELVTVDRSCNETIVRGEGFVW